MTSSVTPDSEGGRGRFEGFDVIKKQTLGIVVDGKGGRGWNTGLECSRTQVRGIRARKRSSNTFGPQVTENKRREDTMSPSGSPPLSRRERLRRARAFGGFVPDHRIIYMDLPYGEALQLYLASQGITCQVTDEPFPGTIHLGNDAASERVEELIANWLNGIDLAHS